MNKDQIKKEILESINFSLVKENHNDLIKKEIDILCNEEDVSGEEMIFSFYKIWKSSIGKCGNKNEINSWLAFYLGMTSKEPDGEFLPERRIFARAGFPDIDSDFDYETRDKVYDYIIEKYGRDYVGNIGTYGALNMKSYIKRAVKAIDPTNAFVQGDRSNKKWKDETIQLGDDIVKSLPDQYGAKLKVKDKNGQEHEINTVEDAYNYCKDFKWYIDKYPDILKYSRDLEGIVSIFGVHAAGIVISNCPLDEIAPLRTAKEKSGNKKVLATQFSNEDLEQLGLIKFDILALSTLSVISRCVKMIKENYDIDIDIENVSLDDKKTYDLYKSGKLIGVFQCEEAGMQRTMMDMQVDSFDDIMAGIALYRPGPMASIPKYCARKLGKEKIDYYHKDIEKFVKPYLKKTWGLLVYQEQIMQICNALAGFSITDGYVVIKAIGKKKKYLLTKYRNNFISGCVKNNIDKNLASEYWDNFISPFALYGFNKSHSACYAFLSYQTAYLKANFPEEFICSYLNVEIKRSKWDKVDLLEKEAEKNMGIKILPKEINNCSLEYSIEKNNVIKPSILCKGLSGQAAVNIIENQPYSSMKDLAEKTDMKKVDKKAIEALAEANFFPKVSRSKAVEYFCGIREDLKKARRKGVAIGNIFS